MRSVDAWFERYVALRRDYPQFPSVEIEQRMTASRFVALVLRAPDHPDFPEALAKAEQLFGKPDAPPAVRATIGFYLLTYYLWLGKFAPARGIVDWLVSSGNRERAPPIVRTFGKMAETWFAWLTGDGAACIVHMNEGLELARVTGVHIWEQLTICHGVTGCLNRGNVSLAAQLLDTLERELPRARDMDRLYYYGARAWFALLHDDVVAALAYQQQALQAATRTGILFGLVHAHFGMALVMHASRDRESAEHHLGEARRLATALGGGTFTVLCDLAEAELALAAADEARAAAALRRGFGMARQYGFTTFTSWRPRVMARLCAAALAQRIEVEYVTALIRSRGLESPPDAAALDAWPVTVKIYALGQFTVLVEGQRLEFATKAQKKPLELLKAMIALGGTQVREEKIADLLWPDSEAAEQALKSAVHRLRKLIGETAIERGEGRLTLRQSHCWVDAFALDQALDALEEACRHHDSAGAAAASARVLALYRGDFLATEAESVWALPARERLRSRTLRHVESAGRLLEGTDRPEQALECYAKGLEIDSLAEPFYRGLIRTYAGTGRRAEALHAYDRCRGVLAARLKVAPSAATEALVHVLRSPSESDR
jgi:DNA-binding SARP family transcriptional activator